LFFRLLIVLFSNVIIFQQVEDRVLPSTAETSGINKNIAKSVSLGTTTPATGSLLGGAPLKLRTKAIPKSEAYHIFTTKTANGMEPLRETETKRRMQK
jgi:hypothetical protein